MALKISCVIGFDWKVPMATGSEIFSLCFLALLVAICSMAVVGNVLILTAFKLYKEVRKGSNLMLMCQGLADLIMAVGIILHQITGPLLNQLGYHDFSKLYCTTATFLGASGVWMAQSTMVFVALERVIAISLPISYDAMSKTKFLAVAVSVSTLFAVSLVGTAYVGINLSERTPNLCTIGNSGSPLYHAYLKIAVFTLPTILVTFYGGSLIMLKYRQKTSMDTSQRSQAYRHQIEIEAKVQRTVSVIMSVYIFGSGIPTIILTSLKMGGIEPGFFWLLIPLGSVVNAACNFFVYYWRHAELRNAFKKMWLRISKCGKVEPAAHVEMVSNQPKTTTGGIILSRHA